MKSLILTLAFIVAATITFAQAQNYQLSSHILDVSTGLPASEVTIKLEKLNQQMDKWSLVDEKITDENGRVNNFLGVGNDNYSTYRGN
jgi:5-hydroxyisourate hydrolase